MTNTTTHFTAWLTTDPKLGLSHYAEIDILEDELMGEDPEDRGAWTTKPGADPALTATTTVRKDDGDDKAMRDAAWDTLTSNGWRIADEWEQTDHGYIATVERA